MKKALALSSMVGSVALPTLSMLVPKVGLLALLSFAGLAFGGTALNNATVFNTFLTTIFYAFFTAGGLTPTELILAF